jgi:protease I
MALILRRSHVRLACRTIAGALAPNGVVWKANMDLQLIIREIAMNDLEGFRVAVLATDGFEESELIEPMAALKKAGADVTVISPEPGKIQGFVHDVKGRRVKVDQTLEAATTAEFDAVQLPGGCLNADALRMVPEVQKFLRDMQEANKPLAAICHAPWLLISAGLVRGRTLTSYHTIQDDITNAGGKWMDRAVVEDQNWVTSRSPDDLPAFNRAMLDLFAKSHTLAVQLPGSR